ncbi:MAG TPA: phosphopantetheine-binding protein [Anaerolineae bacterium]|nr:phosphopantetheine-binding protein [Anaerolineae bacterium]
MEISKQEIETTIKQLLVEDLQADPAVIAKADRSTPLLGRGIGLDSVEALRLSLGLENRFEIQIPDADLTVELFSSLGALTDYVYRKAAARKEPV